LDRSRSTNKKLQRDIALPSLACATGLYTQATKKKIPKGEWHFFKS